MTSCRNQAISDYPSLESKVSYYKQRIFFVDIFRLHREFFYIPFYSERKEFLDGRKVEEPTLSGVTEYVDKVIAAGQWWLNMAWRTKLELEKTKEALKEAENQKAQLVKAAAELEKYKEKYGLLSPDEGQT
jgi:hypothetical protein